MKQLDKIFSLIGFAKKAGCLVTGVESVGKDNRVKVLFLCKSAEKNTSKEIKSKAKRENLLIIVPQTAELSEYVLKKNCKTAGITHAELAKGILQSIKDNQNYLLLDSANGEA